MTGKNKINGESLEALGFKPHKSWGEYTNYVFAGDSNTITVSIGRGSPRQIYVEQKGATITAHHCRTINDLKKLYFVLEGENFEDKDTE